MGLRDHPVGRRGRGPALIDALRRFHESLAWFAITANAVAGLGALAAWRQPAWRGRWVWILAGAAQVALLVEVTVGAVVMSDDRYTPHRLHTFYGFVGFATVGIAYASRDAMRGRLELFYGLIGLFLMGIGIRAYLQA